jgi:hypothetical protein
LTVIRKVIKNNEIKLYSRKAHSKITANKNLVKAHMGVWELVVWPGQLEHSYKTAKVIRTAETYCRHKAATGAFYTGTGGL